MPNIASPFVLWDTHAEQMLELFIIVVIYDEATTVIPLNSAICSILGSRLRITQGLYSFLNSPLECYEHLECFHEIVYAALLMRNIDL